MMKFLYKQHMCIGLVIAILTITFLMMEDTGQSFFHYYNVLYNRTYFLLLYMPLFLLGLLTIIAGIFVDEMLLRFEHKLDFMWKVEKRILFYALFFAVSFFWSIFLWKLHFAQPRKGDVGFWQEHSVFSLPAGCW